ncbi:hypothetical protein [Actinomadura decatromicini]|uniref:Uncharacterized protein n=1 Tax=Actinomadura decatromicini TaxID=2604572 RepID=A0A5D3F5M6_9ACTN|nr:hypothetical protein [Actinomadura decatromicini]TYK43473.1 hypothetical protein FXF68_38345 [Actinomadura decatromicini]
MREELRARLRERWETALDEQLAIAPTSPVPILNELLAARLKKTGLAGLHLRASMIWTPRAGGS